jgi:putative OPT family oligopeptide transporter
MNETSVSTDPSRVQLTIRAVATGMLFGGILSLCNIYTGLKVGWLLGMSMTAALLSYGLWQMLQLSGRCRGLSILETNISQTAASAAASIGAAGLVAPIPALTMLTGRTLSWVELVIWTFSVCLVGIIVSVGLRRQLIEEDSLPFPSGAATANTLLEIYSHGSNAAVRLRMLGLAAVAAAAVKFIEYFAKLGKIGIPGWFKTQAGGGMEKSGIAGYTPTNLTFSIEPTLMMYGVGIIVGPRVGISVMAGALIAWGILAPTAFEAGWVTPGATDATWHGEGLKWLLWPGVALMVSAALTSFAFSWRAFLAAFMPREKPSELSSPSSDIMPRKWFILALVAVSAISVILQAVLFDIAPLTAAIGVMLTFILALVATRVSGETNVTPVTAMGKVTQLAFAMIAPAQPTANLMAANVTGGAASQCADMMHDLKTGQMLGADPRPQFIAQIWGALAGALIGCAGYLILVRDPVKQLLTPEWPAPSVAAWKSVAELFMKGSDALPQGALQAMVIAAVIGIFLSVLEKTLSEKNRKWIPSPTSIGLAFVLPAFNSISLFLGAMVAWGAGKLFKHWAARYLIIIASGIIAGESLSGVVLALVAIITGNG